MYILVTGRYPYNENNIMTFFDLTEKEFQRFFLNLGYTEKITCNTKFSSSGSTCRVQLCVLSLFFSVYFVSYGNSVV